ncbi:MAG: hypothetical protein KF813_03620 [Trueperaceae bacterium]|nr:hypothetical protein [Trueperaceae bacterium]
MADPGAQAVTTAPAPVPTAPPAPLDEVMLAMDVVDTLRHREQLVAKELASGERDEDMYARLRQVYAAQGIEVPERILREGVTALRENRFVYTQKGSPSARRWAMFYVQRRRWGTLLLVLAVLLGAGAFAYDANVRAPRRALLNDLQTTRAQVVAVSEVDAAGAQAARLYQQGVTAFERGDFSEARVNLTSLEGLLAQLRSNYTLRIVAGPDSGVWRIPDINTGARNYYLIVEALDANGRQLSVPVLNEETGTTHTVRTWGLRVSEETFFGVRDDKADDGIIQNDVFGHKRAGYLEPDYIFPTTGAAITEW